MSRPLRPHEIAKRDQALAAARAKAAEPGQVAIVEDDAPDGTRCSMCDCPPVNSDPASHDDANCPGCPDPAAVTIIVFATPQETSASVCAGHLGRARQILTDALHRATPNVGITDHPESQWRDPA